MLVSLLVVLYPASWQGPQRICSARRHLRAFIPTIPGPGVHRARPKRKGGDEAVTDQQHFMKFLTRALIGELEMPTILASNRKQLIYLKGRDRK